MVEVLGSGRRCWVRCDRGGERGVSDALAACPGVRLEHTFDRRDSQLVPALLADWGPVRGVWEGWAADPDLRRAGSSGGAASALAVFGFERQGFHGVLHTAARDDAPYLNETVLSTTCAELLARTGSRYAPTSPCDGLQMVEDARAPCVFIGKPCDVAAVQMARRLRPALDVKIGLTIAFFCAGVPSTQGTLDSLRRVGVADPARVVSLRYRGHGWPGRWTVRFRAPDGDVAERSLSYAESWGFLARYVQWRCRLCPDHTGEFADIAVGDPWYRRPEPGEPGRSLIVARTVAGLDYLRAAAAAGFVVLDREDASLLPRSQPNLLRGRGAVWGRLLALRLAGLPAPRFRGFPLFRAWLRLGLRDKAASVVGTWRRIARRGLRRPQPVVPFEPLRAADTAPAPDLQPVQPTGMVDFSDQSRTAACSELATRKW